jgi:hypothetical protein
MAIDAFAMKFSFMVTSSHLDIMGRLARLYLSLGPPRMAHLMLDHGMHRPGIFLG